MWAGPGRAEVCPNPVLYHTLRARVKQKIKTTQKGQDCVFGFFCCIIIPYRSEWRSGQPAT